MTFAIFHDFPVLENGIPKFHDFHFPGGTLLGIAKQDYQQAGCPSCLPINSVKALKNYVLL